MDQLEAKIAEWRAFVGRQRAVDDSDAEELEAHLRDQIADLDAAGLTADEAFLIAVNRIGKLDDLSREFGAEHTGRLWKQLVLSKSDHDQGTDRGWVEAVLFAVAAAVTVQVARLVAGFPGEERWVFRNASLLVLPYVIGYFARRRGLPGRQRLLAAVPVVIAAVVINVYPFDEESSTEILAAVHLLVVLWFVAAFAYTSGVAASLERRMDFVRFTGEWLIYYALIALGGGVLMGLSAAVLEPAGIDAEGVIEWVVPLGAAGAVIVAAWLVESKQQVVENMAPVLTVVFTPLFAAMLIVATAVHVATGLGGFDRDQVAVFDALMVVVLGLVLYGMSAREPSRGPGWMDRVQLAAVVSALVLDVVVLGAMFIRIGDLGLTPNRLAALGLNVLLLVNLAGSAWLSARFLLGLSTFHRAERWQMTYLPLFGAWAAAVVVALPPIFSFD